MIFTKFSFPIYKLFRKFILLFQSLRKDGGINSVYDFLIDLVKLRIQKFGSFTNFYSTDERIHIYRVIS